MSRADNLGAWTGQPQVERLEGMLLATGELLLTRWGRSIETR